MTMSHAEQDAMARQAGEETGDVFPSDTPWRRRFVELVEDAKRRETCVEMERLREMAVASEKWRGLALAKGGDGRVASEILRIERENEALRKALSYYAETSNWRRAVRNIGPRKAWTKPSVASDRGGLARLVLMELEGAK